MNDQERARSKLDIIMAETGEDVESLMDINPAIAESEQTHKGICINDGCSFITDVKIEEDAGHCDKCGTDTVKSVEALADMMAD